MQIVWDKENNTISVGKAVFTQYYNFKKRDTWVKTIFQRNGLQLTECHPKKKNKQISDGLQCSASVLYSVFQKLQYKAFVVPHKTLLMKIGFARGRINVPVLQKIAEHKEILDQAYKDGQFNILPIIAQTGMTPKQLKETYKSSWKTIAKNSLNKNKALAKAVEPDAYSEYCSLPTTLLEHYGSFDVLWLQYAEKNFKGLWSKTAKLRTERNTFFDTQRMAGQLGKSFSASWTPRRMKEEHESMSSEMLARKYSPEPIKALDSVPIKVLTHEDFTATLLVSAKEIAEEGKEMGHCVAGYVSDVRDGEYLVYSIRTSDGERSSTLGVRVMNTDGKASYKFSQHYGKYNKFISDDDEAYVAAMVMEHLNA